LKLEAARILRKTFLGSAVLVLTYSIFDYSIKYLGAPPMSIGVSTVFPGIISIFFMPIASLLPWLLTFIYNAAGELNIVQSKKLSDSFLSIIAIDEYKK
jgi:hypothetical protein